MSMIMCPTQIWTWKPPLAWPVGSTCTYKAVLTGPVESPLAGLSRKSVLTWIFHSQMNQMLTTPILLSHLNATIIIILTQTVEHISYLEYI
jgi:hypothetical protein